ncbi:MAG: hypothetical protein ACR2PL_23425 [Dehalococcoidia bacterium]
MPALEEAANTFARDLTTMNFARLMTAFTPDGMMKAMALQGQMMAQAQAGGQTAPPATPGQLPSGPIATSYELAVEESSGDDHPVQMTFHGPAGTGVFRTIWREVEVPAADGQINQVWKVNDMAIVQLTPKEAPQAQEPTAQVGEPAGGEQSGAT